MRKQKQCVELVNSCGAGLGSGMRKMWTYGKDHIGFLKWEILKYMCGVFGMLLQRGVIDLRDP